MPRVIISSGHTQDSPGSQANELSEYNLARAIAKKVTPYLRQQGIITLSVPPNLELEKRLEWINKTGYDKSTNDVAIEVHINEGGKRGIEVWHEGDGGNKSKELSEFIVKSTSKEASLPNQGNKSEYTHEFGSITFLNEVNAVTSLIECCYIDNEEDARFLKNEKNLDRLALGIAKGVSEYFGINFVGEEIKEEEKEQKPKDKTPEKKEPASVKNSKPIAQQSSTPRFTPPPTPPRPNPMVPPPAPMNQFPPAPAAPSYGGFGQSQQPFQPPQPMMSRDQRKEMINKQYVKILGREPNQNDLNYFLNIGIKEDDLIKKMVESQEHADLVKSRQEVITTKEKFNAQQTELIQLRASVNDQKNIIKNLHALIAQKNHAISHMQQQLSMIQAYQNQNQNNQVKSPTATEYKGTFLDRLFKAFSDLFE